MEIETMNLRDSLVSRYAQMIYNGFWFAPEREAIKTLITKTQERVSGEVRLKLYKGQIYFSGRQSEYSLYDENIATMEGSSDEVHNQNDATGFIALQALRLKTYYKNNTSHETAN